MKAALLAHTKEVRDDGSIVEVVIWELPEPLAPCTHSYKYRLFFGRPGLEYVRYDNERGKGDHRHVDGRKLLMPSRPSSSYSTTLRKTSLGGRHYEGHH